MKKASTQLSNTPDRSYEAFLQTVRPIALGLVECVSKLDRATYAGFQGAKDDSVRILSSEYELTELGKGCFDAAGTFTLAVAQTAKSEPALKVQCKFEAHFHCKAPLEKKLAERFVASELRLVLWPYFRELVSNITAKMAIQPITIPLVRREAD